MGLEKGEEGQHCYFRRNELLPFEVKGILGSGGFGQVDKVLSSISFKEYARKRVPRNKAFGGQGTEGFKQFVTEIEILKRLKHHHVVEFVGSYTDPRYMGLIMSPVAEMDLSTYLARADTAKHGCVPSLVVWREHLSSCMSITFGIRTSNLATSWYIVEMSCSPISVYHSTSQTRTVAPRSAW